MGNEAHKILLARLSFKTPKEDPNRSRETDKYSTNKVILHSSEEKNGKLKNKKTSKRRRKKIRLKNHPMNPETILLLMTMGLVAFLSLADLKEKNNNELIDTYAKAKKANIDFKSLNIDEIDLKETENIRKILNDSEKFKQNAVLTLIEYQNLSRQTIATKLAATIGCDKSQIGFFRAPNEEGKEFSVVVVAKKGENPQAGNNVIMAYKEKGMEPANHQTISPLLANQIKYLYDLEDTILDIEEGNTEDIDWDELRLACIEGIDSLQKFLTSVTYKDAKGEIHTDTIINGKDGLPAAYVDGDQR